jgi:hypothetical protein
LTQDPRSLAHTRETGVSAVCSHCKRYWEGRALRAPSCTATLACAGPLGGLDFPEYEGVLTELDLASFCLMCGAPAAATMQAHGRPRKLGVCRVCAHKLARMRATDLIQTEPPAIITMEGKTRPLARLIPPLPKKNLARAIMDAEDFFDDRDKSRAARIARTRPKKRKRLKSKPLETSP